MSLTHDDPTSPLANSPATWAISLFSHIGDTAPKPASLDLAALVALLAPEQPKARPDSGRPLWSPTTFDPPLRKADNAREMSALVLDIDDGSSIDAVWGLPWAGGAARILHTSYNHMRPKGKKPAHPRCRLVLPFALPCPADRFLAVWAWAAERCAEQGVQVDEQCKNLDRFYFLPSIAAQGAPWEARAALDLPPLDWRNVAPSAARATKAQPSAPLAQPSAPSRAALPFGPTPRERIERKASEAALKASLLLDDGKAWRGYVLAVTKAIGGNCAYHDVDLEPLVPIIAAGAPARWNPEEAVRDGLEHGALFKIPLDERPISRALPPDPGGNMGHLDQAGDPEAHIAGEASAPDDDPERFPPVAPLHRPAPAPRADVWERARVVVTGGSLRAEPPAQRWLVRRPDGEGFLPLGTVGVLGSPGGVGKTRAVIELGVAVAAGLPWLAPTVHRTALTSTRAVGEGFRVDDAAKGRRVLLLLAEESRDNVLRRLHYATRDLDADPADVAERVSAYALDDEPSIALTATPRWGSTQPTAAYEELRALVEREDPVLVVIDPLASFSSPETETSPEAATALLSLLSRLTKDGNGDPCRSVLLVHHTSKGATRNDERDSNALRGSSALTNRPRWVALLTPEPGGERTELRITKANDAQRWTGHLAADPKARGRLYLAPSEPSNPRSSNRAKTALASKRGASDGV